MGKQRLERLGYYLVAAVATAVVLIITLAVWNGSMQGNAKRERVEIACIEDGGSYVLLGDTRTCLRLNPGEEVVR